MSQAGAINPPYDPTLLHPELEFQTARSGGKGGQNVNKVETKVELRFGVTASAVLTDTQKTLLLERLATKINSEGVLVITHQTERSQLANKEKVLKKFNELVINGLKPVVKRKRVPVPAGVKEARMKEKAKRSEVKQMRGKVDKHNI